MSAIDPVVLKLTADVADYNRTVEQAERLSNQRLNAIGRNADTMGQNVSKAFNVAKVAALAFVSAQGLGAIKNLITSSLEYAANLGEVAAQAGVTTTALQEYQYAATQVNLTDAQMTQGLEQLNRRLGDAALGTGTAGRALARLGIDLRNANGEVKNAADIIPEIAEAMQGVSTEAEKAALRQELFGRSGQKMAALLEGGAAGVNQLRNAAHELGIVLSERQIAEADKAADKLEAVKRVLSARIAGVVADNAGAILTLANSMERLIDAAARAIPALQRFWHQANAIDSEIKARTFSISPWSNMREQVPGLRADAAASWARVAEIDRQQSPGPLRSALALLNRAGLPGGAGAYTYNPEAGGESTRTRTGGGGARARIGPSAEELARAIRDATLEAQRLTADLDMVYAETITDARERAEAQAAAQKARIAADLAADLARVEDTKNISAELKAQHSALHEQTAAVRKQIVEQELAVELERQANERRQDAERRRATLASLELDALDAEARFADTTRQRNELERRLLATQQEEERIRLDALNALGQITDYAAERAAMERRHAAEQRGLEMDQEGPGARYMRFLRDEAENLGRAYEEVAVRGLERIEDALTRATKNALGLHGVLGDIIGDLIRIGIQRQIIGPLANAIFGPEGGGGGGLFASIGKLFGGGRASGGFVNAGQAYRVNEAASPGRVEGFMPLGSGKIIPLGQMNAMQPAQAAGGPILIKVQVTEGEMFEARVEGIADGRAVQVVQAAAPVLTERAVGETFRRASRPGI